MTPRRILRRRVRGWRAPACSCGCGRRAWYVGRGTRWGNPYKVVRCRDGRWAVINLQCTVTVDVIEILDTRAQAQACATDLFRQELADDLLGRVMAQVELRGHDLMCWCPPDAPCHADVLLEVANREPAS